MQHFPKNNILPPPPRPLPTRTRTCGYQGVKTVSFPENFAHILNDSSLNATLTNSQFPVDYRSMHHRCSSKKAVFKKFLKSAEKYVPQSLFEPQV